MKVSAPPYKDVILDFEIEEVGQRLDKREQAAFIAEWPQAWPVYRQLLQELFSSYDHRDLLADDETRVAVERLVPNKKINDGADLLLRFSFDDSGITWDVFQKGKTIVHAQPVF